MASSRRGSNEGTTPGLHDALLRGFSAEGHQPQTALDADTQRPNRVEFLPLRGMVKTFMWRVAYRSEQPTLEECGIRF